MATPIWVHGRVPNGYWHVRANRVRYMRWLARRLGIRRTEDWYRLKRRHFHENYGGGLLASVYGDSPLAALHDSMPARDWKPWLLSSTPQRYWHDRRNRRRYMDWLGTQLGFRTNADWHQLTQRHFRAHHGTGLLGMYYQNSPLRALKDYKPRVKWREWELGSVTQGFWQRRENRVRYVHWLGEQLGFRRPEHWYQLKRKDFREHRGEPMLRAYPQPLPIFALREAMPEHDWKEWLFARVPNGFWAEPANRRRYMRWLGQTLGFRRASDWYRLSQHHVRLTGGGSLLNTHYNGCLADMLSEYLPQHDWCTYRLNYTHDGELTEVLRQRHFIRQYAA